MHQTIAFLYSRPQYQVEAVQFASALIYYGLLRVPPTSISSQVEYLTLSQESGKEVAYLDFPKLISRYTKIFSQTDSREALEYLYLICLSSDSPAPVGKEQVEKCHDMIKNLVLESRNFEELLGGLKADGQTKIQGLIEKNAALIELGNESGYLIYLVKEMAMISEKRNRIKDSIILFNLAKEWNLVIKVLNRELGSNLMDPVARPPLDQKGQLAIESSNLSSSSFIAAPDILSLAKMILSSYEKQNHIIRSISIQNLSTLKTLFVLKEAISYFHASAYETSLQLISSLDLIPLKGDVISITRKAEEFKTLDENLIKNLENLLLMVMKILYELMMSYKNSNWQDGIRNNKVAEIKTMGKAIMMWAGMLRFRLSNDAYAKLTRLDVYVSLRIRTSRKERGLKYYTSDFDRRTDTSFFLPPLLLLNLTNRSTKDADLQSFSTLV